MLPQRIPHSISDIHDIPHCGRTHIKNGVDSPTRETYAFAEIVPG
jgi:hypothetical protein